MGGQITRNSFYGKTSVAVFSAFVTVIDQFITLGDGIEFGNSNMERSVRVKDVGVLAARNTFTLKVDKFLPASESHDSLFSNVRPMKILHSFMILHRKKNRFPARSFSFGHSKQDGPEFKTN